jgi:hypothetical protein
MTFHKRVVEMAFHEAGHAVVARMLGVELSHVALFATTDEGTPVAQTHSAAWLSRNGDLSARLAAYEKDITVMFAAAHAQNKHRPRSYKKLMRDCEDDVEQARNFLLHMVLLNAGVEVETATPGTILLTDQQLAEMNEIQRRLWAKAATLVEENWPAIEQTAEALLDHKILVQDEVDLAINKGASRFNVV